MPISHKSDNSKRKKLINVPVVMYHSVVDVNDDRPLPQLSCPVATFESHLKALRRASFDTISPQILHEYMIEGRAIPAHSVLLTFDDGYLDNWVYAYPLLKKYGFRATIFVSPEFVDSTPIPRPNLQDVWNKQISIDDLPTTGFLSWAEMKKMEHSGVMDIQSHALTHTWHFSGVEIVDFHHPGDSYMWLAWNARPERKHLWMTENQQTFVPWGTPIYQHEKSLTIRRYLPDTNLDETIVNYVQTHGNKAFFQAPGWRETLQQVAQSYRQTRIDHSRFESDKEYKARLRHELSASRQIIGNKLNKTVNFLCWPGGGYNEAAVKISQEVGYLASTLSSRHRGKKNVFGADPSRWGRISPPAFRWDKTTIKYNGGFHLVCLLNAVQGNLLYTILFKLLRVPFKLSQWFSFHP